MMSYLDRAHFEDWQDTDEDDDGAAYERDLQAKTDRADALADEVERLSADNAALRAQLAYRGGELARANEEISEKRRWIVAAKLETKTLRAQLAAAEGWRASPGSSFPAHGQPIEMIVSGYFYGNDIVGEFVESYGGCPIKATQWRPTPPQE